MSDISYVQPIETCQHQNKIKASRFIADIFPLKTEEEVSLLLTEVKKREYTANHHCFAWRIGVGDEEVWRVSDDGEPAGTAGKPIYQTLVGANLTNVLAVVTRYFGGTKLGKGGFMTLAAALRPDDERNIAGGVKAHGGRFIKPGPGAQLPGDIRRRGAGGLDRR